MRNSCFDFKIPFVLPSEKVIIQNMTRTVKIIHYNRFQYFPYRLSALDSFFFATILQSYYTRSILFVIVVQICHRGIPSLFNNFT